MRWKDYVGMMFRWLIGFALIGRSVYVVMVGVPKGAEAAGGFGAAYPLLMAVMTLLLGMICFSLDLVYFLTTPFRNFFHDIFYPRTRYHPPQPDYTLARYYRKHLRHPEALGCYQRILDDYPKDEAAYEEAIAFALECGEAKIARKWSRRADRWCRGRRRTA